MRYMLLIIGDESQFAGLSDEERAARCRRWAEYTEALVDAGTFVVRRGPPVQHHRDHAARGERRAGADRRPVRRDEGADRRLLR